MSERKKSMLPSMEIIIILVFFLSFIVWAVSKCSATKQEYATNPPESTTDDEVDTDSIYFSMPKPLPPKEPVEEVVSSDSETPANTSTANSGSRPARTEILNRLYITIDGLNMRTHPHLDSSVVEKLKLFEEVGFMNEETEFKQEINLGKEMANETWLKVKTKRGKIGWVYGAGIDFRKKKREGVQ